MFLRTVLIQEATLFTATARETLYLDLEVPLTSFMATTPVI
ncbi:hypothetical protein ACHAXN_000451 [Cyclotella atomus]